jgi:hypothetical protein
MKKIKILFLFMGSMVHFRGCNFIRNNQFNKYMKRYLFLFSLMALAKFAIGQSDCGVLSFVTQAEVDQFAIDFPDCNSALTIEINIVDGPTGITDLSPLSGLTSVTSYFALVNNSSGFVSTGAFANLVTVGGNMVLENVNDPDGFLNLTTVEGQLNIVNADPAGFESLSLDGFANLQTAGFIHLAIDNPSGDYLNVFPNLTSLTSLYLGNWPSSGGETYLMNVNTLSGFNQITTLTNLEIGEELLGTQERINNLSILNALVSLTRCSIYFLETNNWSSLAALESMNDLFSVIRTSGVIDFPSLTSMGTAFIWMNGYEGDVNYSFPVLQTVDGLVIRDWSNFGSSTELHMPALLNVTSYFEINGDQGSGSITSPLPPSVYDFGSLMVVNDFGIIGTTLQSLDIFSGLDAITGSILILMNPSLSYCAIDALCARVNFTAEPDNIEINDNHEGCASEEVVATACAGNTMAGHVYLDVNCNSIIDPSEPYMPYELLQDPLGQIIASTNSTGFYLLGYTPGETISFQVNGEGLIPTGIIETTPESPFGAVLLNVPVCPDMEYQNVSASIYAYDVPRPGFNVRYFVHITNHSYNSEIYSASLDLSLLPGFILTDLGGGVLNGSLLEFNNQSISGFETLSLEFALTVPVGTPLGSAWNIEGIVTSSADNATNTSDNAINSNLTVLGSFDPNDMMVDRSAIDYSTYDLNGEWLNYQIRFQNTGTAAAEFIRVLNVMDEDLDLNTFEVVETSHASELYFNENRELEFYFDHIQLPDSASDPEGSNGFIRYRIKTIAGLNLTSVVENTAAIYFDFNEPIITNTATTSFYSCPVSLHPTGVEYICFPEPIGLTAEAGWESYQWSLNGSLLGTSMAQTFSNLGAGSNLVTISAETVNCAASVDFEIFVFAEVPTPVLIGSGNTLFASGAGPFSWTLDGNPLATTGPVIEITQTGVYAVSAISGSCTSEWAEGLFTYTGVSEFAERAVNIFPNPAGEIIQIVANGYSDSDVLLLINADGKTAELKNNTGKFDVSTYARGLYILQSRDANGNINWQERLILQ